MFDELRFATQAAQAKPVVNSFNEWDLLEEVIVGVIDGATVPTWDIGLEATMPGQHKSFFQTYAGQPFPAELMAAARTELEELVHILEAEGVTVRRPDPIDFARPYSTPHWQSPGGLYAAMPRDTILVIGDTLIEAPMAWRSRYFEIEAYRSLLTEYFRQGAKWIAAPKPQLTDAQFNYAYTSEPVIDHTGKNGKQTQQGRSNGVLPLCGYNDGHAGACYANQPGRPFLNYAIHNFEPTFDAADFMRCGRDIFAQLSHVTNPLGIEWLQRHLGPEYTIHLVDVNDPGAMHIDATFIPLAPGKLLLNPSKMGRLPDIVESWEIKYAPPSCIPDSTPLFMSSKWLSMNLLSLDEERVIVEKNEGPLIQMLKDWGFKPILCNFRNFNAFGGSFHCATLDVRRRGVLESYF